MITPIIHRGLTREDLARLVAEIGRVDQAEAHAAEESLQAGEVDAVLDSPAALEAVHGRGGAPAAVPLTLLWYVPVRAALRARGVTDVELADYVATVPVVFATWRAVRAVARGETGISVWWRYVASLPDGTVAQAEGAADVAALALWWAGACSGRMSPSPPRHSPSPHASSRARGPSPPCALVRRRRQRRYTPRWRKRGATTWVRIPTALRAGSSGFSPGSGRARLRRQR